MEKYTIRVTTCIHIHKDLGEMDDPPIPSSRTSSAYLYVEIK